MMKTLMKVAIVFASAMIAAAPASSAILMIDVDGKLAGARDVTIAGKSYDITFVAGTCAQAFGVCNNNAFAFRTVATAQAAAQALFNQVFIDTWINGKYHRFDQMASLTVGCDHPSFCQAVIPVETLYNGGAVSIVGARNGPSNASDFVTGSAQYAAAMPLGGASVYARFVAAAPAVPEPATWAMMLLGFGGIGAAMRRRGRVATTIARV